MAVLTTAAFTGPDSSYSGGISRSLALGRVLHFEALMRRRQGEARPQRYIRMHLFYANQNLPPENIDQPLMINLLKTIVDKHTSYMWGQWKGHLFQWRVTPREDLTESLDDDDDDNDNQDQQKVAHRDDEKKKDKRRKEKYAKRIKAVLDRMYEENKGDRTFWAASKNSSLYGDAVLRTRYDERERRIVWENVLPEYFHCMWNLLDMEELTEVIIAYPIDRQTAFDQYSTYGNDQFVGYNGINPEYLPGIGVYWERWNHEIFQVWIDDINVTNIPNPYCAVDEAKNVYPGLIPFIHVSNMQAGSEYWGYGDAENCIYLIEELNRRMADMGDIVNNHAHPVVTLSGYTGQQTDLHVGPDEIWDLGRDKDAKAERLEGTGPQPEVMAYLDKVIEMIQHTSNMPEAALGHHSGGTSHQSGLALMMAMMPVIERAREKRIFWKEALTRIAYMSFYILSVRDSALLGSWGLDYNEVLDYMIEPVFADILPKERLETVNEAVARTSNMLESIPSALGDLGVDDIPSEYERIKQDTLFKASVAQPTPPAGGGTGGKNSEQGQGGAPGIPGAIGASAGKPGTLIKDPTLTRLDDVSMSSQPG